MNKTKSSTSLLGFSSSYHVPKVSSQALTKSHLSKYSPYTEVSAKTKSRKKEGSPLNIRQASPGLKKSLTVSNLTNQQKNLTSNFYSTQDNYTSPKNLTKSMNISLSNSFNGTPYVNSFKDHPGIAQKLTIECSEIQILESKLIHKLKELSLKENQRITDKLEIYRDLFQEIIRRDSTLSPLLSKIRDGYDEAFEENRKKYRNEMNMRLSELNSKLGQYQDDKNSLEKKIDRVMKEKYEIELMLEKSNQEKAKLQEKLRGSSEFDHKKIKMIVEENKVFSVLHHKQKKEISKFKYKENQLLKLILALKKRGYPVEDVYDTEINKSKRGTDQVSELGSESEDEQLVSGRPKEVKRPKAVPKLNLNEIQSESPYDSSSPYESESSSAPSVAQSI